MKKTHIHLNGKSVRSVRSVCKIKHLSLIIQRIPLDMCTKQCDSEREVSHGSHESHGSFRCKQRYSLCLTGKTPKE